MATSTKFRPLARLIEKNGSPFWVISADGRLVFLSAALGKWLSVEPESLVGRMSLSGASLSDDPLDHLAASLAPPPGLVGSGTASLLVQPTIPAGSHQGKSGSTARPRRIEPMETRFVRLGEGDDAVLFAFAGIFRDLRSDPEIESAVALRQQLDSWRRHHESIADTATVGKSRRSQRLHRQIELAGAVRGDVLILSPPGCLADSIATWVHHRSADDEPLVRVDGPLMDAELLDASLGPAIYHLADSEQTTATAVLRSADETPLEAQLRLGEHLENFGRRLRLIAITGPRPIPTPAAPEPDDLLPLADAPLPVGIEPSLADRLCGLRIEIAPLRDRTEDIPVLATAFLDRRRSGGEVRAERISRAALDALVLYPWPENLHELDQAIRHAARSCPGEAIGREHLPLAIRSYHPSDVVPPDQREIDLDQAVADFEHELIRRTLDAAGGNRAEAARRLNVSRARLLRKIETLGLEET